MNNNEMILNRLRDIRMEKMIKLKEENRDIGDVDIEDLIYCGNIVIEENGEEKKKNVFLLIVNYNGSIRYEYHTEDDLIAIDYNEMIIPTKEYQKVDFNSLAKNEKNRVSLNDLEIDRIKSFEREIDTEIEDSNEVKVEDIEQARKKLNIKDEFSPNKSVTTSETFGSLVKGTSKYEKIAVIAPKNSKNKYEFIGIKSDGTIEKIKGLQQTEGTGPMENTVAMNRTGSVVDRETVSSMYRIKGDDRQGFAIDMNTNGIQINYFRRDNNDNYLMEPIESKKTRSVYSTPRKLTDLRRNITSEVTKTNDKAINEQAEHSNYIPVENIDKNKNNDIDHNDIIKTNNGEEKKYEDAIKEIERSQKASRKEAERLFYSNKDEGETYEKVISDVEEEVEQQMRIDNNH